MSKRAEKMVAENSGVKGLVQLRDSNIICTLSISLYTYYLVVNLNNTRCTTFRYSTLFFLAL